MDNLCYKWQSKMDLGHPFKWLTKCCICHKRGVRHMFLDPKTYDMPPFLATKKLQSSLDMGVYLGWRPNFFSHHLTHPHHQLTTKIFRWPNKAWGNCFFKNDMTCTHPPLNCWRMKISIAIWHTPIIGLQLKFFSHHLMVGVCQMAIKKYWSPSNTPPIIRWQLNVFNRPKGHEM